MPPGGAERKQGMKAKHQRLVLVMIALLAIVGAGLLAAWTLRNQANYFYLPELIGCARAWPHWKPNSKP